MDCHPSRLIGTPTSAIPTIFTKDALPYTTLPIYPGLGQAPNILACIAGGLVPSRLGQSIVKIFWQLTAFISYHAVQHACPACLNNLRNNFVGSIHFSTSINEKQVSADADGPARRTTSRPIAHHAVQCWTLSVINRRRSLVDC